MTKKDSQEIRCENEGKGENYAGILIRSQRPEHVNGPHF